MAIKCAVVIVNWNGEELLHKLLPYLVKYSPDGSIYVIDNGSSDGSVALLHTSFPMVHVIVLDQNYGFAEGYNKGLKYIEADYYMLVNSDVEVSANWLVPLIEQLDNHSDIAAIMPKVLSYNHRDSFEYAGACGGELDLWGFPYCRGRLGQNVEKDQNQYSSSDSIFWASGAAMMIRSGLFFRSGGFDASFFAHMEEIDLCWRLHSMGYKVAVEASSKVWHIGGATLGYGSPNKLFLNLRNSLFMLVKNLPLLAVVPVVFSRLVIDGMLSVAYLAKGDKTLFTAVVKAHMALYRNLPRLARQRKGCLHSIPRAISYLPTVVRYFL